MQKTKILFFCFRKTGPILARGLEKLECSLNVGADKFLSIVDGAVYVTFRRKVNDCRWLMQLQQIAYQLRVIDISVHEHVTIVIAKFSQIGGIASICKLIKIHNPQTFLRQPVQYEVGTDKTGSARHQNRLL